MYHLIKSEVNHFDRRWTTGTSNCHHLLWSVIKSAKFQTISPTRNSCRYLSNTEWYRCRKSTWYSSENVTDGSWNTYKHHKMVWELILLLKSVCVTEHCKTVIKIMFLAEHRADLPWLASSYVHTILTVCIPVTVSAPYSLYVSLLLCPPHTHCI